MIRIAICDDNPSDLSQLKDALNTYVSLHALTDQVTIIPYSESRELWFHLDDYGVAIADIYILDIDMPGMDGLALATAIRKHHPYAILFFFTSHSEYASEGYKVSAIRYILKTAPIDALYEALDTAIHDHLLRVQNCLTITHHRDIINIPFSDIVYIERVGRTLYIHTRDHAMYEDNRTIQEIQESNLPEYFVLIDRGTILNVNYIKKTDGNAIHIFDGLVFTISRRRIVETKNAISRAWLDRSHIL